MTYHILTINPGATSTKIALFADDTLVWKDEWTYTAAQLAPFAHITDQFNLRLAGIEECLAAHQLQEPLDTVVGRGGLIGPVQPGAIVVDEALLDRLAHHPVLEHASNLGAPLAHAVVQAHGVPGAKAYIYDPVTVDSMSPVARITGLKELKRQSVGHHLNMHAVAMRAAASLGKAYDQANIIVVHMGGGCSASAHEQGTIVDFVSDDEYMFSAERSGGLAVKQLLPLVKQEGVDVANKRLRSNAGLMSHYGSTDLRAIVKQVEAGTLDPLPLEGMALGIAKCIAALSATMNGHVDLICLTGGMAYSDYLCQRVAERVSFIAPFKAYPGEFELQALSEGGFRVLTGQEFAGTLAEKETQSI